MRYLTLFVLAAFGVALSGANCGVPQPAVEKPRTAGLRGFSSAEELHAFLVDQARTASSSRGNSFPVFGGFLGAAPSAPTADQAAEGGGGGSGGYSTTNIQEIGVDESDIVKNDGQTIYALDGNTVHIVRATPAGSVAELARVQVDASADSMYLRGNRLVVLSRPYGWYYGGWGGGGIGWAEVGPATPAVDIPVSSGASTSSSGDGRDASSPTAPVTDGAEPSILPPNDNFTSATTVTVFDVSDPAQPQRLGSVQLQGDLGSSRLIDNKLHVVVTTWPQLPGNPTPAALQSMPLESWIPDATVRSGDGSVISSGDVAGWQDFFRPIDPDGYAITTIVTIDIDNPAAPFASTAISANAGTLYASREALYITDTQYPSDGLSYRVDTMIHKLRFTEAGTDYVASGLVTGRPLNQYSLGEHEGYLRIATHLDDTGFSTDDGSNSVYVLGESGESLAVVGSIEGIAPGEDIYAARFVGKRGFLVTFRRIDPLFTIDLSDPTSPRLGANPLKVPGYSDHIQLLDENHLLTIGKDAQDAGAFAWVQGVQLSIFDVTDPDNPTLLHKELIGGRGTSSEANSNPKAFNYYAPLGALALPIDLWGGETSGPEFGRHEFTGLYVYDVSVENGFRLLGRISSSDGVQDNGCYSGYYGFTRGVFIGEDVYSVTQNGVKVAGIDDLSTLIGQTTFPTAPSPVYDCTFSVTWTLPVGVDIR